MRKALLVLIPVILLVVLGYWFWSLGSVPASTERFVELSVQQEGVQVKQPNSDAWEKAVSGMRIGKGWSIKTDESGLATVRFYHQGESRLDRNSEMTISEAVPGDDAGVRLKAEVTLQAGRVWSRVLRLLDIDSSYSVRTSEVVATVRGTGFDVEKNSNGTVGVAVADSAVTVAPASAPFGSSKAIGEGMVATFSANGTSTSERALTDEDRSSGWYVSNDMADQTFVKAEIDRRTNELKQLDGLMPDTPLAGVAALSERIHLSLASDETKNALLKQYLSRRLYHLIELVQSGKTGLAAQEFSRMENDIQAQLNAKDGAANVDYIRTAVLRNALLMDESNPDDALYPFKQKVERLFETVSDSSELSRYYARMLAFDSRLDEATRLIAAASLDDARVMLDGVKSGVENIRRDSASLLPTLNEEYRSAFEGKLSALKIREQVIRTKLEAALHPLTVPASSTSTEAIPGADQGTTATTTQPATAQEAVSLSVKISPNTVEIGQRAKITVTAKLSDGSTKDVTAFSTFSSVQFAGKLNGPSYIGTAAGKDEVVAHYQQLEAKGTVQVTGEVKMTDLVISSSIGTKIGSGQMTQLTATARYNNGATKNVTNQTTFIIVSGGGSIQGSSYIAGGTKETTIAGTYKDQDLTSIGSLTITINP